MGASADSTDIFIHLFEMLPEPCARRIPRAPPLRAQMKNLSSAPQPCTHLHLSKSNIICGPPAGCPLPQPPNTTWWGPSEGSPLPLGLSLLRCLKAACTFTLYRHSFDDQIMAFSYRSLSSVAITGEQGWEGGNLSWGFPPSFK